MKFSIGDKVVKKEEVHAFTSYNISEVVGTLNGVLLIQHWGHGYDGEVYPEDPKWCEQPGTRGWHESIERFQEEELLTPEEAIVEIHRLEAEKSQLNQEFDQVRSQLQEKLDQAASLVQEVADRVTLFDKGLPDLKQECQALHQALVSGGWRQSSMDC